MSTSISIATQANRLIAALIPWAQSEQGVVVVASDLLHMWEQAYQETDRPKAILCFANEQIRGDFSVAASLGRVDRLWYLAVTRGRGWGVARGDALTTTQQNARPFYDYIEEARDIVRCLENISVELPVDYKGIRPMERPGLETDGLIDGYIIEFSTASDLPQIVSGANEIGPSTSGDYAGGSGENTGTIVLPGDNVYSLQFVQQPSEVEVSAAITPSVTVRIVDQFNQPLVVAGVSVTLALNQSGATLGGTLMRATDASGIATFSGLTVDTVGTYTLRATADTYTQADSDQFYVRAAVVLRVDLPCLGGNSTNICECEFEVTDETQPGYSVQTLATFHVRGNMELFDYVGGVAGTSFLYVGGTPATNPGGYNNYKLTISSPAQTFWLNSSNGTLPDWTNAADYSFTALVDPGATIQLLADSVNGGEHTNRENVVVTGVPPAPAAFNGQFVQVNVTT